MSKQVLSIEQMRQLQDIGVDTKDASMCYVIDSSKSFKPILCISGNESEYLDADSYIVPAFTLSDLVEFLPNYITDDKVMNSILQIELFSPESKRAWSVGYMNVESSVKRVFSIKKELIDSVYEIVCWLAENGYV